MILVAKTSLIPGNIGVFVLKPRVAHEVPLDIDRSGPVAFAQLAGCAKAATPVATANL
jgi:hypothetical protein